MLSMPTPLRHALRIVVQNLGESQRYRLIAYSDAALYRPLEFTSRAATLSVLRHLVADIDEKVIAEQDEGVNPRIVFAADVNVTDSQLHSAGLTRQA
jgi:hypothetical protein